MPRKKQSNEPGSTSRAVLRKRVITVPARSLLTKEDLFFCLELPLLLALSWLLPERRWARACFRLERIKAALGFFSSQSVEAAASDVFDEILPNFKPAHFALRVAGGRSEHHLQILRCYRPGGWKPDIALEGEEHLRDALASGRGVVLWVAHFCFNALAVKMAFYQSHASICHS